MGNSKTQYFLFGSYLRSLDYNDIDVLIVIDDLESISNTNNDLDNLRKIYPDSLVHTHIYTRDEYLNTENKFSYKKVNKQISRENFLELFATKRNQLECE